jgi:hypothetical protein
VRFNADRLVKNESSQPVGPVMLHKKMMEELDEASDLNAIDDARVATRQGSETTMTDPPTNFSTQHNFASRHKAENYTS